MRLTQFEIQNIKKLTELTFGHEAEVYIFGSRRHDHQKGGDIDLLIRTENIENPLQSKIRFIACLKPLIGDQKIDLIIRSKEKPHVNDTIYIKALSGEKL